VVASTAAAAQRAARERNTAALASRRLARFCNLDVLVYPVQADIDNLTMFLAIGGRRRTHANGTKTSLAVRLPNRPGALCRFLEAFRDENVNLSRLISRPIRGCPRQYAFLVDLDGSVSGAPIKRALREARKTAVEIRTVGCYPARRHYTS
jgi:prephenate dehydratase